MSRYRSSNTGSVGSGGTGLVSLLTVAFIVLKLVPGNPVNHWSWWWVLSPLWISFGLGLIVFIIVLLVLIIKEKF